MNAVTIKAQLNKEYIRSGQQTVYLMVEIQTSEGKDDGGRTPVNIGFVLDRSGSMAGDKLAYTKQAVSYAVGHLRPGDYGSLTVYDNEVETLLPSQHILSKDAVKGIVSRIFPGGSTNLSGGLIAGYREVMKHNQPGQTNRVLLLTDGLANAGITDKDILCHRAQKMREMGVAVTTLGVGNDFDEDLLTAMAEESGGNYYFIENTDMIPRIFAQELESLLSVVAQNVKLRFASSSACQVTKVWGYQPGGDTAVTMNLPDLFSSDHKYIMLELTVHSEAAGKTELGSLTLSYDEAGEELKDVSCHIDLAVEATEDPLLLAQPEKPEVIVQLALSRSADIKEEAIRLADEGQVEAAATILKNQQEAIKAACDLSPSAELAELTAEYDNLSEALIAMERREYNAVMRKKMSFQSYQRRRNQK